MIPGVAGGRLMIDVNVGFIVQSYLIYSWTNDTEFFDEIYPFAVRAVKWLIKDATKGRSYWPPVGDICGRRSSALTPSSGRNLHNRNIFPLYRGGYTEISTAQTQEYFRIFHFPGTGLPYRKGDAYDLFELEKYDHSAYNSIMYLLGLRTMIKMSQLQSDKESFDVVNSALARFIFCYYNVVYLRSVFCMIAVAYVTYTLSVKKYSV